MIYLIYRTILGWFPLQTIMFPVLSAWIPWGYSDLLNEVSMKTIMKTIIMNDYE